MSRIAKLPILIPSNIKIYINNNNILIQGNYGKLNININKYINIFYKNNYIKFLPIVKNKKSLAITGTMRALTNNIIIGVNKPFIKKLNLVGIGYRTYIKNNILFLILGFSHKIKYIIPNNIIIKCHNQNEIIIKGINKQLVGQVAANIRSYKKPESYKGKGIRYFDEIIKIKEVKKK